MFFSKYPSHTRVTIDPKSIFTVGHVDTALFITLCLVSIEMALLARVQSNSLYCNVGEIGMVGSTFTPPCDPQKQELLV